ncbi:hypothetical protein SKAU_G00025360 [Synaphobranchus kaupii]|uniref:Uncharacterized protein n=1 Tax=Synaphobranchus kaupii TaxID=118154 RepID=A0A9Q1GDL5_SYNKA|nr:hypothetical protein SKAU_G00025360 [Synaphobranchus kaupii]
MPPPRPAGLRVYVPEAAGWLPLGRPAGAIVLWKPGSKYHSFLQQDQGHREREKGGGRERERRFSGCSGVEKQQSMTAEFLFPPEVEELQRRAARSYQTSPPRCLQGQLKRWGEVTGKVSPVMPLPSPPLPACHGSAPRGETGHLSVFVNTANNQTPPHVMRGRFSALSGIYSAYNQGETTATEGGDSHALTPVSHAALRTHSVRARTRAMRAA